MNESAAGTGVEDIPLNTARNATALGSEIADPVRHATDATNAGDVVRSVNISLNNPTSGSRHVLAIKACMGPLSFEYDFPCWGRRESKNDW